MSNIFVLKRTQNQKKKTFSIAFSGNFSAQIIDDCGNRKVFRFCYNFSRLLGSSILHNRNGRNRKKTNSFHIQQQAFIHNMTELFIKSYEKHKQC